MPGQLNVVSVSTAPASSSAICRPMIVITGTSALRKAWLRITLRCEMPRAWAAST